MAWSRTTDDQSSSTDPSLPITPSAETTVEWPRKLPPSKFKGVVPQPNGRWGAQIYENHHRVWLGTFTCEESAARAYDAAAIRFRGRDAAANFKPHHHAVDEFEFHFLNSHSKSDIVDMLRKHTYADELDRNRTAAAKSLLRRPIPTAVVMGTLHEHLFEKSVTPSDVGKLNRLVIPKQFAERHFPLKIGDSSSAAAIKGVLMNFEDRTGKVWRFRYSYWNSSQSYVLTKGWSGFVREKNLVAGDLVSFQRSVESGKEKFYIDWKSRSGTNPIVRLFGVDILVHGGCGGKRVIGEDECLGFQSGKRLRLVGL